MKTLFDEEEAVIDKKWISWQEIALAYMASRRSFIADRREIYEQLAVRSVIDSVNRRRNA